MAQLIVRPDLVEVFRHSSEDRVPRGGIEIAGELLHSPKQVDQVEGEHNHPCLPFDESTIVLPQQSTVPERDQRRGGLTKSTLERPRFDFPIGLLAPFEHESADIHRYLVFHQPVDVMEGKSEMGGRSIGRRACEASQVA